jgi:hypothetical protein
VLPNIQPPIGVQGKYIDLTIKDNKETSVSNQEEDLDVEIVKSTLATGKVIDTYRPPQQSKKVFDKSDSTEDAAQKKIRTAGVQPKPCSKRPLSVTTASQPCPKHPSSVTTAPCPKRPLLVTTASQKTPLATGSRVSHPVLHATTQSPSTPRSNPTSNPGSKTSPQELYCLKMNTLALALVALQQIVVALQLVKGRKEMAKRATLAKLIDFVCDSRSLVQMLQGSPLGMQSSPLLEVEWASQPNGPEEEGGEIQNLAMVEEGRDFCKLTWDLLNNQRAKHKTKFCADSSLVFLSLFRQRCYGVWATVEEARPSLGKRKKARW